MRKPQKIMRQVAKKRLKALSVATASYCINQTKGTKFLTYIFFLQSLYTVTTNPFTLTAVSRVPVKYPRKCKKSTYVTFHSRWHLLLNRSYIGNLISNICFLFLQSLFTMTTNPFRLSVVSQVPLTYPQKHEKSTYGIFYSRRQLLLESIIGNFLFLFLSLGPLTWWQWPSDPYVTVTCWA